MAKHNKKRNVGLLHEQLVRHVSEMTVEGNAEKAEKALSILVNHFKKGSALFNEFRLFSALAHPRVGDKEIARRIIEESKKACANHDLHKLNKEKSQLIREINHTINREDFYNQRIENYRVFSTIQALLNEWRGKNALSADERIQYEIVLENHLSRSKENADLSKKENADPLVLNIMIEKFNNKYNNNLTLPQRKILEACLAGNDEDVLRHSRLVKIEASKLIEEYFGSCDNKFLSAKKEMLEEKVNNYIPNNTEESVTKALMLSDLINELEGKDV